MGKTAKEIFLVTGALGCIGAWTLYHLVKQGKRVVSFDISDDRHRLNLLLSEDQQQKIVFVRGDLTDFPQVQEAFQAHRVTHVIHLAALQVPFCKADPVKGAAVNVLGTVNVFEAAHRAGLSHIANASSIAVYGPPREYSAGSVTHDAPFAPRTLYGVYKQAGEGVARIYWQDYQLSSVSLRPYTVYGVGRDQGLTSEPTKAMLAAATGQSFHISFGGKMQFQFASDVALQLIEAATISLEGAHGFNLGPKPASVADVVRIIRQIEPDVDITHGDARLPFPESFDDSALKRHLGRVFQTPLNEGIRRTITQFKACFEDGRITIEPS